MHGVLPILIPELIIDFGECPRSESNGAMAIELDKVRLRDVPEMRLSDHRLVNTQSGIGTLETIMRFDEAVDESSHEADYIISLNVEVEQSYG